MPAAGTFTVQAILRPDLIHTLTVPTLGGFQLEPQLFADLGTQEASHAVRLPARSLGQITERGPVFAAQQFQNRAALSACRSLLSNYFLPLALGRLSQRDEIRLAIQTPDECLVAR